MTGQELKQFVLDTLVVPRSRAQEISVLNALIDFSNQSDTADIPAWTAALTFNSDGSGDGAFATYLDTDGKLRFWISKTIANINNAPPTSPSIDENAYWKEVSPSPGSGVKEWAAGIFGAGLIIVFYDVTGSGLDPALYVLAAASRPFNSTDFIAELAAGSWLRIGTDVKSARVVVSSAEILALFTTAKTLVAAPGANKYIELLSVEILSKFNTIAYAGGGASALFVGHDTNPAGSNYNNTGAIITNNGYDTIEKLQTNQSTFDTSTKINKSLSIGAAGSNPTTGNGTLIIFVTYKINSIT